MCHALRVHHLCWEMLHGWLNRSIHGPQLVRKDIAQSTAALLIKLCCDTFGRWSLRSFPCRKPQAAETKSRLKKSRNEKKPPVWCGVCLFFSFLGSKVLRGRVAWQYVGCYICLPPQPVHDLSVFQSERRSFCLSLSSGDEVQFFPHMVRCKSSSDGV